MKDKTFDLKWYVYRYNINRKQIYKYNVFDHGRFYEEVCELISGIMENMIYGEMTYEKFTEKLRYIAMYYFWSKAEHEIVITSWPPYIDKQEFERIAKEDCKCRMHINLDCGVKIDIYEQLRLNWDVFVDYVWNAKK